MRLTTGRRWELEEKGAIEGEGAGGQAGQGGARGRGTGPRLLLVRALGQVSGQSEPRVSRKGSGHVGPLL